MWGGDPCGRPGGGRTRLTHILINLLIYIIGPSCPYSFVNIHNCASTSSVLSCLLLSPGTQRLFAIFQFAAQDFARCNLGNGTNELYHVNLFVAR